jgi:hypothetical protein
VVAVDVVDRSPKAGVMGMLAGQVAHARLSRRGGHQETSFIAGEADSPVVFGDAVGARNSGRAAEW